KHGDFRLAERAYRLMLRAKPDDRRTALSLADLYVEYGRAREGISLLERWVEAHPKDVEARAFVANVYCNLGEPGKAKEHLDLAYARAAHCPAVLGALGHSQRWEGNLEESSKYLRASLQAQETPDVLYLLADNLIDGGERQEAVKLLTRALEVAP